MANWTIKSADLMKVTQDRARNPLSASEKEKQCATAKDLGSTHIAISTPYDTPPGAPDANADLIQWLTIARAKGLKIWHRHSWCSDQGFYDVPKNITNDRIADTVKWITDHPDFFKPGDVFTPKPEPQNTGVIGMNSGGNARFPNVAAFNKWLRDMTAACKIAFLNMGMPEVKVGYYGFDGFVVCGYANPDWEGKTFLEKSTVEAMDNILTVDHYETNGRPMSDFLRVFKKVWPGVQYFQGEWGATADTDQVQQVQTTMGTLAADPVVIGFNYWQMGPDGREALINDDYSKKPVFDAVKKFFTAGPVPTPTPEPTPIPVPAPIPQPIPSEGERIISAEGLTTVIAVTNRGNLWKYASGKWTKLPLPTF